MSEKEKLIQILCVPIFPHELADPAEVVADYLLDNDVVPVVRCRDCRHYVPFVEPYNNAGQCARKMAGLVAEKDYCSYGERKDNDD